MRQVLYVLSYLLALPCAAFALGIVTLNHVIVTRNVFKLFYHFLLAFGWGLPVIVLYLAVLLIAGFFLHARFFGSIVLLVMNVAALCIIGASPAMPHELSEFVFLLPSVGSAVIAGYLVVDHKAPVPIVVE